MNVSARNWLGWFTRRGKIKFMASELPLLVMKMTHMCLVVCVCALRNIVYLTYITVAMILRRVALYNPMFILALLSYDMYGGLISTKVH